MRRLRQLNSFGRVGIHGQPWGWTPASGLGNTPNPFVHYDTFTDIPGTLLTAHMPEIGGPYTDRSGGWAIDVNNAYVPNIAIADPRVTAPGIADGRAEVMLRTTQVVGSFMGMLIREAANESAILAELEWPVGGGSISAYTRSAGGVYMLFGSTAALALLANTDYKLTLVFAGTAIDAYIDDILQLSVVSAFNQAESRFGMRSHTSTHLGGRFDLLTLQP